MARQSENMQVAGRFITPATGEDSIWVRTGDDTAVPGSLKAVFLLEEPPVQVLMKVRVDGSGRPRVEELSLVPNDPMSGAITTTTMRGVAVDALMREALEHATIKVKMRPDVHALGFQVPGDPDNMVRVSPDPAASNKGTKVPKDRVDRAAQVYLNALSAGSNAPAEVVAKELGYSRATAARDIRAARKRNLLPPLGEESSWQGSRPGVITGTGTITRMPMSEFIEARTQIEEELGLRKHPGVPFEDGPSDKGSE